MSVQSDASSDNRAEPASGNGSAPAIPGLPPDWPQRATETLVSRVDEVRVKTSGPAISVARMVVYGVVALPLLVMALILLVIGLVRGLDVLLDRAWLTYVILGGVFTVGGLVLWSKRPKGAARPAR